MQAGKNAKEATKEAASDLGESVTAGMHKTRAAVQGQQADGATAHTASSEQAAAEATEQSRVRGNAAAREHATGYLHPSQGAPGVGADGAPTGGHVEGGVGQTRPVARATGTGRPSAAHNPHVGSDFPQGRGTGGQYQ